MKTSRFNDILMAKPIKYSPPKPTIRSIAAIGRAIGDVLQVLSNNQQKRWFGANVFGDNELLFDVDANAFVVDAKRFSPLQVLTAANENRKLAQ